MVAYPADALASPEPIPSSDAEHPVARPQTRRVGRLRLPIAGAYRPWATLYALPDGRLLWTVRLWEVDRPVSRCLPTSSLRAFCERNRLPDLRRSLEALVQKARELDG